MKSKHGLPQYYEHLVDKIIMTTRYHKILGKMMIFLFLASFSSHGQEPEKAVAGYDPVVDILSEKFEAGPYLIYDCVDKHWVCVLESYYKNCEERREADIFSKMPRLPCAPIGAYPTKKSCFQRQLYLVGQNLGDRFCLHPSIKQRNLDF